MNYIEALYKALHIVYYTSPFSLSLFVQSSLHFSLTQRIPAAFPTSSTLFNKIDFCHM